MSARQKKLLLLDDDYESMEGLQLYMQNELGLRVEFSADANLLKRLDQEKFDLIIVDLMIHPHSPNAQNEQVQNIHYDGVRWDRTGLEFIRRFRAGEYTRTGKGTSTSVPIIVLSAVADSTMNREWGKTIQSEHHLEKPFRLSELSNLICRLLQE
jgi:CheY-like chemotaxis protein